MLPETEKRDRVAFDWAGAVVLAVGATALLFSINRGPSWGWSAPAIVAGFVVAPLALAAFVGIERRTDHPLLPLAYVRERTFTFAIARSEEHTSEIQSLMRLSSALFCT